MATSSTRRSDKQPVKSKHDGKQHKTRSKNSEWSMQARRAQFERKVALWKKESHRARRSLGLGAVGGSRDRASEHGERLLTGVQRGLCEDDDSGGLVNVCADPQDDQSVRVPESVGVPVSPVGNSADFDEPNLATSFDLAWVQSELYERFACELCSELLAAPYSFKVCEHAFCARCIIRWFFKTYRDGAWHSQIKCPSCSMLVPNPSMQTPRNPADFPFVPNLIAARMLHAYSSILSEQGDIALYTFDDDDGPPPESGDIDEITRAWAWGNEAARELVARQDEGQHFMDRLDKKWVHGDSKALARIKALVEDDLGDMIVNVDVDESKSAVESVHDGDGNVSANAGSKEDVDGNAWTDEDDNRAARMTTKVG